MTKLFSRAPGPNIKAAVFYDKELEAAPITVNQDAYDPSLDRVYNVKGLKNIHVEFKNTGGSNGMVFKIENVRKEYTDITTLTDADFDEDILVDTNIAFGEREIHDIVDVSPETTAIRIRMKRQTASQDTTATGFVSAN